MLINTLNAYEAGDAEIIEQIYKYIFTIKFNNEYRVLSEESIKGMYNLVKILKPAH